MDPVTAATITAKGLQGLYAVLKLLWEGYSAAEENKDAAKVVQKFCEGFKAQPGSSSSTDPMDEVVQEAKALVDEYDNAECTVLGKKLSPWGESKRGAACFRRVTSSYWKKKFADTLTRIQEYRGRRTLSLVAEMNTNTDQLIAKFDKMSLIIYENNDLLKRLVRENRQREEEYTSLKKVNRELETFAKEVPAKLGDRRDASQVLERPFVEELAPVERMAIPQEVRKTEGPDSVEAKLLKLREELNRLEEEHPSTDLVKEAEEYLARNTRTGDDIVGTSSSMKN